jgi:hypothetical protein
LQKFVSLIIEAFTVHSKKRYFTEPPKMIPEVCGIEKTGFQIYETFKDSSLGHTSGTFECETWFKFCRVEKGFVEEIGNLQSIVLNPQVLAQNNQDSLRNLFCSTELETGFASKGSAHVPKERTFKGFIDLKTRCFDCTHLGDHFRGVR